MLKNRNSSAKIFMLISKNFQTWFLIGWRQADSQSEAMQETLDQHGFLSVMRALDLHA